MASRPNRLCYLLEPLPSPASSKMSLCGVKVWESISGAPVCGRPTCRKGKIDVHGVRTLHAKRNRGMATGTTLSGVKRCGRNAFGGAKDSGYGREGGTEGLYGYTVAKNVSHKTMSPQEAL